MSNLVYFNQRKKSWILNTDGNSNPIRENACLHNVKFVVIPEIWEDIWKRIGLGVPQSDARDPYPHAFLISSCLIHASQFTKKLADTKEIIYNFEKGIFTYNDGSDLTVTSAKSALITSGGKIFI